MNFEELQKTWQAQPAGAIMRIATDALLREVRRNQRHFSMMIFWRDVREVGLCALLALFFGWQSWRHREWATGVLALACAGVGAYMLVDRWRQRRQRPQANDPLKSCITDSLQQVTHQIQLLKSVFWWYLLPFDVGLVLDILVPSARTWNSGFEACFVTGLVVGFCALVSGFLYWVNQYAVRQELEPRRRELEGLLAGLNGNPPPGTKP